MRGDLVGLPQRQEGVSGAPELGQLYPQHLYGCTGTYKIVLIQHLVLQAQSILLLAYVL